MFWAFLLKLNLYKWESVYDLYINENNLSFFWRFCEMILNHDSFKHLIIMKRTKICTFSVSTHNAGCAIIRRYLQNCVYQYLLLPPFYSYAKLYKDLIHTRLYQKFINNVVKEGPFSVHVLSFKMEINSEVRFENTLHTCIICADS